MRAPTSTTVSEAATALLAGMRDGSILDRSETPYKPSTIRGYELSVEKRLRPVIGHLRLCALERRDVQALVDAGVLRG